MKENSYWHAVYTKPRWEKKVAAILDTQGIEYYCPLQKVQKQWSDRKKIVLEPVFKSYVFVKVNQSKKWEILNIQGIVSYVNWLGKPAVIKQAEIITIKKFLNEFTNNEVISEKLELNSTVKVTHGILMDYHGILLRVSGNKASVRIESMGIQLTTIIDKRNLEPFI